MSVRNVDADLFSRIQQLEDRLKKAERGEGVSREVSTEALLLRSRSGDRYRIVAHEQGLLVYNETTGEDPVYWPVDAPSPVLVAGDSIAAGVPYNDGVPWSNRLLLPGVVNIAMGGQAWHPGSDRPPFVHTIMSTPGSRQTVIISGGTNDVGFRVANGHSTVDIVSAMAKRITDDLRTLHQAGFRVYLTTIWPVGNPDTFVGFLTDPAVLPGARQAIIAINDWLRANHAVRLIDLDPVVCDPNKWMKPEFDWIDHVHPNQSADLPVASVVDSAFGLRP